MKRFLFDCGTRDEVASAGLLVYRLAFGLMMAVGHGWTKLGLFSNPEVKNGWLVPDLWPFSMMSGPVSMGATIFAELGCGLLVALGVATRPAAFVLGFAMVVAAFQKHGNDPFFMSGAGGAKEPAMLYLFACLGLIFSGGGKYSGDAIIFRERKRRFF